MADVKIINPKVIELSKNRKTKFNPDNPKHIKLLNKFYNIQLNNNETRKF